MVELGAGLHFYQPERQVRKPSGGLLEVVPWINETIYQQVYRPLLAENSLDGTIFSFFTTLRGWVRENHPSDFCEIQRRISQMPDANLRVLGDPFLHIILPFMDRVDLDILLTAGRIAINEDLGVEPSGLWLPECAVSTPVLEAAYDHGYRFVVLMDDQVDGMGSNPVNVRLPRGREMGVFGGERWLSGKVAHDDGMTIDSWGFLQMVAQGGRNRFFATDGETFGHHKPGRDQFAAHVFDQEKMAVKGVAPLLMENKLGQPRDLTRLREETSWSCAHGVRRWKGECGCGNPSHRRLEEKRAWHYGLLERKTRIKMALDREAPGWQAEFPGLLAANRFYLFNEKQWNGKELVVPVDQFRGRGKGERITRLEEAYQMCLVAWTSCAAFFGPDDSPEGVLPREAIKEIDGLNVI